MNPHAENSAGLKQILSSFLTHRNLIYQMAKREVAGRYKGSLLGITWTFFNPVFMLATYTFVFSVVFKARWGLPDTNEDSVDFALILFVGLIIHAFFAEVIANAPTLILHNANYVKKVVFPLEILTAVNLLSATFHAFISFLVLMLFLIISQGIPHWTAILGGLMLLLLAPMMLGLGWILASLGVFIRDIGQFIGVVITALLFLSPVLYPVSALPKSLQPIIFMNPLTFPIEQARAAIIFGELPNLLGTAIYFSCSIAIFWLGFWWFQKTRKGFADVI